MTDAQPATGLAVVMNDLDWLLDHQQPGNPKEHDLPEIERSMDIHGFLEPVALDGRTDLLLGGHGRLAVLALKRAQGKAPPSGVTSEGNVWHVPTLIGLRSKDDADAREMVVRLNRLTERGGWNAAALVDFLEDDSLLEELWAGDELDDMFGDLDPIEDDPIGADNEHADLPPARKGEPPPPRAAQGVNEILLLLSSDEHGEALKLLDLLGKRWEQPLKGQIMLRALREAAQSGTT